MRRATFVTGILVIAATALLAAPTAFAGVAAPKSYDFGEVPVGQSATIMISVVAGQYCEYVQLPEDSHGNPLQCSDETVAAGGSITSGTGFRTGGGAPSCAVATYNPLDNKPTVCDVSFTFSPPSVGSFSATAVAGTVVSPAASSKSLTVKLFGTGVPAASSGTKKPTCPRRARKPRKPKAKTTAKKKRKARPCQAKRKGKK